MSVLNELHTSLTKKQKAAHTCYFHSLYPYPFSLNTLSKICDALHNFKFSCFKCNSKHEDIQEAKSLKLNYGILHRSLGNLLTENTPTPQPTLRDFTLHEFKDFI